MRARVSGLEVRLFCPKCHLEVDLCASTFVPTELDLEALISVASMRHGLLPCAPEATWTPEQTGYIK